MGLDVRVILLDSNAKIVDNNFMNFLPYDLRITFHPRFRSKYYTNSLNDIYDSDVISKKLQTSINDLEVAQWTTYTKIKLLM